MFKPPETPAPAKSTKPATPHPETRGGTESGKQMAADLKNGEPVHAAFLVAKSLLRTTRTGSAYLDLTLQDRSGQVTGRLWDATESLAASIAVDDFVQVKGRAELYQNQMQVVVKTIMRADEKTLRLGDFLPQSACDPMEMMREMKGILATVEDPPYKALIGAFLEDKTFCDAFRTAPAAVSNHHACLGGLLEHTLSMMKLAVKVLEHYPSLRRDLLLTGVFLHDIGKTRELSFRRTFQYTSAGNLVGHIVIGCRMVEQHAGADFPPDKLNKLLHMILSHHGEYEFGSPKLPMFAEALALHYLDNLDAKLRDFAEIIAEDENPEAEWTEYTPRLGRKLYKG